MLDISPIEQCTSVSRSRLLEKKKNMDRWIEMQRRTHSNALQPLQFLSHVGGMLLGKVLSKQLITCHMNILVLQL